MNRFAGYAADKRFAGASNFALLALMLAGMLSTFVLLDAVLPLQYIITHDALIAHVWRWSIRPTLWFFPGWTLVVSAPGLHLPAATAKPPLALAWEETGLLAGAILLVFLMYLLALRSLPARITQHSIFFSTLLLGLFCITIPVVTSSDVFSYIAYARLDVIYHQNPLTALPALIHFDPVYQYVYWARQPSAYGPAWALITGELQMILDPLGLKSIVAMVLALRLFGLAIHLASTLLIWSISGLLMGANAPFLREKRLLVTLAFAWNPLLLFEVCVNAHNDAAVLFFVLLTLWLLARSQRATLKVAPTEFVDSQGANLKVSPYRVTTPAESGRASMGIAQPSGSERAMAGNIPVATLLQAAILFALATCLKLNMVILMPCFLLFVCLQPHRWRKLAGTALAYLGTIVLLYLPFWQNGAALDVLRVNPSTSYSVNSLAQFVARFSSSLRLLSGQRLSPAMNLSNDLFFHTLSIGIFVALFVPLCGRAIHHRRRMQTVSSLIGWLALVWLLYCIVGSPWLWPWYIVTFFGLYALVEATPASEQSPLRSVDVSGSVRLMAFSMLTLYCFATWSTLDTYVPGLPAFKWAYFAGLWIWLLPLLAARSIHRYRLSQSLPRPSLLAPPDREQTLCPMREDGHRLS